MKSLTNPLFQEQTCKLLIEAIRLGFDKQTCTDIIFGVMQNVTDKCEPDALVDFNNRFVASVFNLKESDAANYEWVKQIYDKAYAVFFGEDAVQEGESKLHPTFEQLFKSMKIK